MSIKINNQNKVILKKQKKDKLKELLSNKEYQVLYLVGNQYCDRKPNKHDKNIILEFEKDNIYDPNAIRIVSIIDNTKIKLGYVSKDYTQQFKSILNKIKIEHILKVKNKNEPNHPYYHLLYKISKYPIR